MGYSIVTFDEAGFRLVPVYKRVWFFKGEKPKGVFFWSNKKLTIFGALIDGKKLFYEFYDALNSLTFKAFIMSFVESLPKRKRFVFLLDNAGYHKTSPIMNYLNKFTRIKVEFFPPYSPELNPTETCWKIVRANVTNSTYYPDLDSMQESIESFLDGRFFTLDVSNYLCR
ncbi:MAG TPA: IS630 family transposase [Candidatus Nanoarchaeia archaeon]|nr:IS630 family transposase [Candidatus Nanoarchaeia archaeon]